MIKFSEEFKEALLKAKGGKTVFVLGKNEDGSWEAFGNVYSLESYNDKKSTLTLKAIQPEAPSEEKKALVKTIVDGLRDKLKSQIASVVEAALLEKTPGHKTEASLLAGRTRTAIWSHCLYHCFC